MKEKKDTYSYKGWLNSDNFFKRSFAVLGYYTVANIIIFVPILILAVLIGVIVGSFQ